jgi:hypothetical protein
MHVAGFERLTRFEKHGSGGAKPKRVDRTMRTRNLYAKRKANINRATTQHYVLEEIEVEVKWKRILERIRK